MPKLAVISDVHDNLPNLKKALAYIVGHKIDYLICTGDLQSLEAWQMLDNSGIPSWGVHGNADSYGWNLAALKNIKVFEEFGEINLADKKIIFRINGKIKAQEKEKLSRLLFAEIKVALEKKKIKIN